MLLCPATWGGFVLKSWARPCWHLLVLSKGWGELVGVRQTAVFGDRRRLGRPRPFASGLWLLEPFMSPKPWWEWAGCVPMPPAATAGSGARLAGGASSGHER